MPVCYNGDITTPAQLKALEAEFPNLSGIMVGRGIIADPALLRQAVGGAPASKEELRGYLDELYHATPSLRHGQLCRQPDEGPLALPHPAVRGFRSVREAAAQGPGGWEYEVVVNQLFTLPLL